MWNTGVMKQNIVSQIAQPQKPGLVTMVAKPNNTLSQQLSEGKYVLATFNGQQVMVRTNATTPNQVRLVTSSTPGSTNQLQQLLTNTPAAVAPLTPQKSLVTETTTAPAQAQTFPKMQQSAVQTPASAEVRQQIVKKVGGGTILQNRLQGSKAEDAATETEPELPNPAASANPSADEELDVQQALLAGQPPGTVIKSVTAKVIVQ